MPATTFSSPLRPDKTISIAFAAVALLGFLEVAAVGLHFINNWRATRKTSQPVVATETNPSVVNSPVPLDTTAASPGPVAPPAAANNATPSNAALSAAEKLLQEATQLRDRGDTTNALARLQDAAQRDPKNANVLAEMAMIYESVQLFDRSNETWRKIQDIGPSAGPLYELALLKLKVGVAPTNVAAAAGPGFAGVSPLDAGTRADRDGIPDGSVFGISEASVTENPDPDAQTNLTLRVGVKKRPDAIADHTKVKIQVYFYDTVDNNKMALTDAEVNYEWVTPDHDWKKNNPEILAVTYVRMKNGAITSDAALAEAAAQVTPPSGSRKATIKKQTPDSANRKYAGYQVRVYFNDQLQDVRAEPTKLLNLFPPPLTLTTAQQ